MRPKPFVLKPYGTTQLQPRSELARHQQPAACRRRSCKRTCGHIQATSVRERGERVDTDAASGTGGRRVGRRRRAWPCVVYHEHEPCKIYILGRIEARAAHAPPILPYRTAMKPGRRRARTVWSTPAGMHEGHHACRRGNARTCAAARAARATGDARGGH